MTASSPMSSRVRLVAAIAIVVAIVAGAFYIANNTHKSTSAATYIKKGVIAERNGRYLKAEKYYRQAIRADKKNALAYYDLGTALQRTNHPYVASIRYKQAVALNPKLARAWYNLGVIERKINWRTANRYFRKALAVNPGFAIAKLNIGLSLVAHNFRAAGINDINLALTENPKLIKYVPASLRSAVHH